MKYAVYLAKNVEKDLYYIGYKSFHSWEEFNKYNTSSKNKRFKAGTIMKCILSLHSTKEKALDEERRLQIEKDVLNNRKFANLAICSPGTKIIVDSEYQSKKARERWSNKLYRENWKISREKLKPIQSENMKKRWRDEKFREEMSRIRRNQTPLQAEAAAKNLSKRTKEGIRKGGFKSGISRNPLSKRIYELLNTHTGEEVVKFGYEIKELVGNRTNSNKLLNGDIEMYRGWCILSDLSDLDY